MSFNYLLKKLSEHNIKEPHLRFAPSPNGKVTFGHLKGLVILDQIRKLTNGKLDLRFDDTNPSENYLECNYSSVLDLSKKLGITFDGVYKASDHLQVYLDAVKTLVKLNHAYVCNCPPNPGNFSLKCFCNKQSPVDLTNVLLKQHSSVIKFIPTSGGEPYVILRAISGIWYPTMALQGPVDDHLQGVNLIIRGRDLESVTLRQKDIYEVLYSDQYPLVEYWGRVSLWNSNTGKEWAISKSLLKNSSKFPSLEFFTHWGVTFNVLKKFALSYGFTKNDIKMDLLKLTHYILKELPNPLPLHSGVGYCKIQNHLGFCRKNYFLDYKKWVFINLSSA